MPKNEVSPVIRVFVSSTFKDMQSERDELIRYVFPRLNREFRSKGYRIEPIDLRWGVLNGDPVVQVCRDLIDESDIFVCLLGDRYGWIPREKSTSITADEIHYGVLEDSSKLSGCFLFRESQSTRAIPQAESRGFADSVKSDSYQRLTNLKARVRESFPNVVTYRATWVESTNRFEELSDFSAKAHRLIAEQVALEIESRRVEPSNLDTEEISHNFLAWEHQRNFISDDLDKSIREIDAFVWSQFNLSEPIEADAKKQFTIVEHSAKRTKAYIDDFSSSIEESRNSPGPYGNETAAERCRRLVRVLAVVGTSGSGRTALLSHLANRYKGRVDLQVIPHFVGASEESTSYPSLFQRMLKLLGLPSRENTRQESGSSLRREVTKALQERTGELPVLLILDDIESLETRDNTNAIRPSDLVRSDWLDGTDCAAIISVDEGSETLLNHSFGPRVVLSPMQLEARRRFVEKLLWRFGKRLTVDQVNQLASKDDGGNPSYLSAAIHELVTWGDFEGLTEFIGSLPQTISGLFDFIIRRLQENPIFVNSSGRPIPGHFVLPALGLLNASFTGLSSEELSALLGDNEIDVDPNRNVPALMQTLRTYLQSRGDRNYLSNSFLREAIKRAVGRDRDLSELDLHGKLSDYFLKQHSSGSCTYRFLREVLHQLVSAERFDEAVEFFLPLAQEVARLRGLSPNEPFLRRSAQEEEAKMIESVLSNWHVGNWHSKPAVHRQNGGAQADYLEVYQYPCCKEDALCEYIVPPQFILTGCKKKKKGRKKYEEAKADAIKKVFLSDAAIDQVLHHLSFSNR